MKKYLFIFIIILLTVNNIMTQTMFDSCGSKYSQHSAKFVKNGLSKINTFKRNGMYIPSKGVFKMLIIFARFSDDNTASSIWGINSLPDSALAIVDTSLNQISRQWSISHYYRTMSSDSLRIIGKVYPNLVVTDYPESWYRTNSKNYGDINKEILSKIDNNVNYSEFDNINIVEPSHYLQQPDGYVDMIAIIYRNENYPNGNSLFGGGNGFTGIAQLGFDSLVTNDNVIIKGTNPYETGAERGCGITIRNYIAYSKERNRIWLIHEFAHYLLGVHYSEDRHGGNYGIIDGKNSPTMSSGEKSDLGYINLRAQSGVFQMSDYLDNNVAYKVSYPHPTGEYYVIENHSKHNIYDGVGVFDLHPAPDPYGKGLYIFHKSSGERDRFLMPEIAGSNEESFNLGYNQVFSPWSKPNTEQYNDPYHSNPINLAITLTNMVDNVASVQVFRGNPNSAPPSKPQSLRVSYDGISSPVLTWAKNGESDVRGYKIYRAVHKINETSLAYSLLNSTLVISETYEDTTTITNNSFTNGDDIFISYKVCASDSQSFVSVASDTVRLNFGKAVIGNITGNTTLSGRSVVFNIISISNGVTVTIPAGASVRFSPGVSLTCNGIINATGTSNNRITFTSISTTRKWGGITFSGSGHSVLSYCNVNYVNGYAISVLNCSGYPYYQFCNIANSTTGIRFDNSNGYFVGNTVENNTTGVEIDNYASPVFGLSPYSSFTCGGTSNNKIRSNSVGVYTGFGTTATIGSATNQYFYGNCLYNNSTYNLHLDGGSTVDAHNIYWGPIQGDKIFNEGGTLRCTTYCTTPPTSKLAEKSPEFVDDISFKKGNTTTNSLTPIEDAKGKQFFGDYKGALDGYKNIITSSTKETNLDEVYLGLLSLFRESGINDIPEYLESINLKTSNPLLESCIANCYAVTDKTDLTLEKLDKIITNYPKTRYAFLANVQKFYQYFFKKSDKASAEKIYNDLVIEYKDDRNVVYLASLLNGSVGLKKESNQNQESNATTKTALGFALSNYPNPFNPSTIIRFSIPQDLYVKLVVYDVTGKEVKTLVNETKTAGTYNAEFNAGKYASGVYYYKLEAGDFKQINKMVLVK